LGLFDNHFRFRAPRSEELVREWARDNGYGAFDVRQPQFDNWRKAVATSLSESRVVESARSSVRHCLSLVGKSQG